MHFLKRVALTLSLVLISSTTHAQGEATNLSSLVIEEAGHTNTDMLFAATLYDLDNQAVQFSAYKGRPMIVNFWARWCGPCRVEIPELVALQQRKTGVDVIGVNIESDPNPVRDFARAYDVNYPVFLTRQSGIDLMRSLNNFKAGLPFTVVINRQGVVVASRMGAMSRGQLNLAVTHALR